MAVTLNKANLVLKDANGNIGKIEQLSDRDLAKIKTAVSDVALVVNQSNHKPIVATKTNVGMVKPDGSTITVDSNGTLTATNATKATQDSAGQQINTTYVKGVTASNATITVTKGNGTTSTATINNVANATTATNATNLGGYPATKYIRSVNSIIPDAKGNVQTGFPSDTFVTIFENVTNNATSSPGAYDNSYTAPANGYVCCIGQKNPNTRESACYINTNRFSLKYSSGTLASLATGLWVGGTIPVKKGDVINFLIFNLKDAKATFIYAEGEI